MALVEFVTAWRWLGEIKTKARHLPASSLLAPDGMLSLFIHNVSIVLFTASCIAHSGAKLHFTAFVGLPLLGKTQDSRMRVCVSRCLLILPHANGLLTLPGVRFRCDQLLGRLDGLLRNIDQRAKALADLVKQA